MNTNIFHKVIKFCEHYNIKTNWIGEEEDYLQINYGQIEIYREDEKTCAYDVWDLEGDFIYGIQFRPSMFREIYERIKKDIL